MYDTETAECVEKFENTPYKGNAHYYKESLFRKKTGEFFLYGYGNARTKYASVTIGGMYSPDEKVIPLSKEEAMDWMEQHGDVDTYIELFGEVEE